MPREECSSPLVHATSAAWDGLISGCNPAGMLVAIRSMMGEKLLRVYEPADVWQETLLHAWRDREKCDWRGTASFRRWLLALARNRVRDLANAASAGKRGDGRVVRFADRDSVASGSGGDEHYAGPCSHTTPGRAASDLEIAVAFEAALAAVPDGWRDVVRLRLFEELPMEEIAVRLGFGVEGVRYRFRKGAEVYRRELRKRRAIGPETAGAEASP